MEAGLLHVLALRCNKKQFLIDLDGLVGQRPDERLNGTLSQCGVLLAVNGPQRTELLKKQSEADEQDCVSEGIVTALKRRIAFNPVLLNGGALPALPKLPDVIKRLTLSQKCGIKRGRFGRNVDDLVAAIKAVRNARVSASSSTLGKLVPGLMLLLAGGGAGHAADHGKLEQLISTHSYVSTYQVEAERHTKAQTKLGVETLARTKKEAERLGEVERTGNKIGEASKAAVEAIKHGHDMPLARERAHKSVVAEAQSKGGVAEVNRKAEGYVHKHLPALTVKPGSGKSFRDCYACPEMVIVPAGSFMMDSPAKAKDQNGAEGEQRKISINKPFAVGKYEITWVEWGACVAAGACNSVAVEKAGGDRGWGKGRRPVINVTWNDAKIYAGWLSKEAGKPYRLLTEAEWEYSARAGTKTAFWWGNSISAKQANYYSKNGDNYNRTVVVDSYEPNPWGLYQVHGNVWEWVEDCFIGSYNGAPSDAIARAKNKCTMRVFRGGSWLDNPHNLRTVVRSWNRHDRRVDNIGFRVARTLTP